MHAAVGAEEGADVGGVAAEAAAGALRLVGGRRHAVDQLLRREEHLRPRALPREVEPVVERRRRPVRPARSAVDGNVLVARRAREVHLGVADGAHVPRRRRVLVLRQRRHHADVRVRRARLWPRRRRVVEVGARLHGGVRRVRLGGDWRRGALLLRLHRRRRAPRARVLDAEVLTSHLDLGEAALAPVRAPAVAEEPVVAVRRVAAPADDREDVVRHRQQHLLLEDAARVRGDRRRRA